MADSPTIPNILDRAKFAQLKETHPMLRKKNFALRKGGDVDVYEVRGVDFPILVHPALLEITPAVTAEFEAILKDYKPPRAADAKKSAKKSVQPEEGK